MTLFRLILVVLGCLCLALGTLGAFLPVLPTVEERYGCLPAITCARRSY